MARGRAARYGACMDARIRKHDVDDDVAGEARVLAETITVKRDRLLASLTLIAGIGVIVGLPFALRAGAEFFMPVTAALVVAIALVPLLEWFERRGIPSKASAGLCVVIFLIVGAVRDRVDRHSRDRLGGAGAAEDSEGPRDARAGHPGLQASRQIHRPDDLADRDLARAQTRRSAIETPNSTLGCCRARRRIC